MPHIPCSSLSREQSRLLIPNYLCYIFFIIFVSTIVMDCGLAFGSHKTWSFNALIRVARDKNSWPKTTHNKPKKNTQFPSMKLCLWWETDLSLIPDQVLLWLNLTRSQAQRCWDIKPKNWNEREILCRHLFRRMAWKCFFGLNRFRHFHSQVVILDILPS